MALGYIWYVKNFFNYKLIISSIDSIPTTTLNSYENYLLGSYVIFIEFTGALEASSPALQKGQSKIIRIQSISDLLHISYTYCKMLLPSLNKQLYQK